MSTDIIISIKEKSLEVTPPKRFTFDAVRNAATELKRVPDDAVKVLIDMKLTEYMDSSALGYLLMIVDKTPKASREIVNAKQNVRHVIEISRIDTFFQIP